MSSEAVSPSRPADLPEEVLELPLAGNRKPVPASRFTREGIIWLIAAILMFVTGLFKGINLLVLLAYLLAGLWVLNHWNLRSNLQRVIGRREAPGPVFAGEPVDFSIDVSCSGRRAVRGVVLVDRNQARDRAWLILTLQPDWLLRIRHTQVFNARGRSRAEALVAYSSFPFGLTVRARDLATAQEWIVLPRLGRVNIEQMKQWLARIARGDGRTRRRQLLPAPQEADIHGLRDYRAGDSPRWIHWRTSARRNQLLVREFEDSAQPHLALVVEPWLPVEPTHRDRDRLEVLISLAGSIVRDWCRDHVARLTLIVAGGDSAIYSNGAGSAFAIQMLEVLAVEMGRPICRDIDWLQEANRAARNSPFLVISTRVDSAIPDLISSELGRPTARLDVRELPHWYEPPSK